MPSVLWLPPSRGAVTAWLFSLFLVVDAHANSCDFREPPLPQPLHLQSRSLHFAGTSQLCTEALLVWSEHQRTVCAVCWVTSDESQVLTCVLETKGQTQLLLWPERCRMEPAVSMRSFYSKVQAPGADGHNLRVNPE